MSQVFSKDGTIITYEQSGQGPTVILISGASTSRVANAALAERLSPHFTVYNYDRRGRGDSSDTLPFAVEREFEDLEALIAEAGGSAGIRSTKRVSTNCWRRVVVVTPPHSSCPRSVFRPNSSPRLAARPGGLPRRRWRLPWPTMPQ